MTTQPVRLPTYKEELGFKTMEAYCNLLDKHEKGVLNNHELNVAVDALIAATGWGLPFDVFITLSSANIKKDESFCKKTYLKKSSGALTLVVADPYDYKVITYSMTSGTNRWNTVETMTFDDELNPLGETMKYYEKRRHELISK